ncbi:hypothetical protein [Williamsia sterculiae]|uniref:Immunity protein 35 n=1 Tax=Williamsia sterculiae TaxID=1344003 RepID=A0A1N7GHN9_9NOCA|nr:hypothetical protein [Williamsia sterculiae]SIS12060.1 hypothetical protein SAMN05445060_2798 [Williamsia sterculiae]
MTERYSPEPEALRLNDAQVEALERICARYGVEYDPGHYFIYPPGSVMMSGYAEGWVGGTDYAHRTLYIGVSPDGRISS